MRLFCFPFAGGAASVFHHWPARLPSDVEVNAVALPGRTDRFREPAMTEMLVLLDALEHVLVPLLDRPYAFYGHSLGALIGWELAHRVVARSLPAPERLLVAARRAPHLPRAATAVPVHRMPRDELVARLCEHYEASEVLKHDRALQDLVLPSIRADFELHDTWTYTERPPLACPITAYGGNTDRTISREVLGAWSTHTTARFDLQMVPGGHLFLQSAAPRLLELVSAELKA